MMERRGDGVSIILKGTHEITGSMPEYKIVDRTNLVLVIPSARLELVPSDAVTTVHSAGEPMVGADVLIFFPNKTRHRATTDSNGEVDFDLYTTHLPMTVYAAMPGYTAGLIRSWTPSHGGLLLELNSLAAGGAVIFSNASGHISGLHGRLNPKRNNLDQICLYTDNTAADQGRQRPVVFWLGKPLRLIDAYGVEMMAAIFDITGRAALIEYRLPDRENEQAG